jgi:hypothetical protein
MREGEEWALRKRLIRRHEAAWESGSESWRESEGFEGSVLGRKRERARSLAYTRKSLWKSGIVG